MKILTTVALRLVLLALFVASICVGIIPIHGIHASTIEHHSLDRQFRQSDQPLLLGPSLDIARAVPYPADFPDLAPTLGFLDGRFVSSEDQALRSLDGSTDEASLRGAKRQLLRAGWLRRYENRLAAPLAGEPDRFGVQVSSFVVEYASPQDAASAFAALAQQHEAVTSELVGDESLTLEFGDTTPDTNTEYRAVKLVFRVGPLLCSITFANLTGSPPPVEAVIAAGNLVAERARVVINEGTVPLGSMLLQFTERGDTRNDVYATRAGVQTSLLSDDTLEIFSLPQAAGDAFVSTLVSVVADPLPAPAPPIEDYAVIEIEGAAESTSQRVNILSVAPSPEVSLLTALFSFNTAGEASVWLDLASAEVAVSKYGAPTPINSPSLGDESVAFKLEVSAASPGRSTGYLLLARLGPIGIVQELRSSTGVSLEGAANVMRQQLACIAQFGCRGAVEIPQSIFGGQDVPLSVDVPAEAPQDSSASEATSPIINSPPPPAAEIAPVTDPATNTAGEPPALESNVEVPEELTEPEITSAPAPEVNPEDTALDENPADPAPTPAEESASGPGVAQTPIPTPDDSQTPVQPEETLTPIVAETPVEVEGQSPIANDDASVEADPATAPSDMTGAPAAEATAAPVPADAPIGATAVPPVDEVVQEPVEADTPVGTNSDFTEPVPAVSQAEPSNDNDNGDREPRRDRKKDREGRGDKK